MSAIKKLQSATAALQGLDVTVENEHLGTIKVKPAISCAKAGEIQQLKNEKGTIEGICLEIVYRCSDENGKPLFSKVDMVTMLNEIDADVITGVFLQIKEAIAVGKSTAQKQKSIST